MSFLLCWTTKFFLASCVRTNATPIAHSLIKMKKLCKGTYYSGLVSLSETEASYNPVTWNLLTSLSVSPFAHCGETKTTSVASRMFKLDCKRTKKYNKQWYKIFLGRNNYIYFHRSVCRYED